MKRHLFGRLLWKETLETRGHFALLLAALLFLTALRQPLTFRAGNVADPTMILPWVAAFVMGIGAYARENAAETLAFAYSRPVRWWWLLLVKAGIRALACLVCALAAGGMYLLALPSVYRPFLDAAGLLHGVGSLYAALLAALALGLGFAPVMRGIAVGLGISYLIGTGSTVMMNNVLGVYPPMPLQAIMPVALGLAMAFSLVPPAALSTRRYERWTFLLLAGLVTMLGLAVVFRSFGSPRPPKDYAVTYGPGGQMVYAPPVWAAESSPQSVWISTDRNRFTEVARADQVRLLDWSPDGRLMLITLANGAATLVAVSRETGWHSEAVATLPRPAKGYEAYFDISGFLDGPVVWSPGRDKFIWVVKDNGVPRVVYVTPASRTARFLNGGPEDTTIWWMDNERLVAMNGETPHIIAP